MKKTINEILLRIACIFFASLLAGCGGGSGGNDVAGPTAVFDLSAAQDNLYNGSSFKLSGSDSLGSNYTATMDFTNQGTQLVNGINAMHIELDISLTNTTTNAATAGTQDLYFTTGYAPVLQVETPGNVQYMPTSVTVLPATASIGDSGPLVTFTKSNGEVETDTWSLDSAANGRAKLTFHITTRDAMNAIDNQETNAITIDTTGTVFSLSSRINDSSGAVLTLSGNKQ